MLRLLRDEALILLAATRICATNSPGDVRPRSPSTRRVPNQGWQLHLAGPVDSDTRDLLQVVTDVT